MFNKSLLLLANSVLQSANAGHQGRHKHVWSKLPKVRVDTMIQPALGCSSVKQSSKTRCFLHNSGGRYCHQPSRHVADPFPPFLTILTLCVMPSMLLSQVVRLTQCLSMYTRSRLRSMSFLSCLHRRLQGPSLSVLHRKSHPHPTPYARTNPS